MSRQWLPFKCVDLTTVAQEFPELPALILCLIWREFEVEATNTPVQHFLSLKG